MGEEGNEKLEEGVRRVLAISCGASHSVALLTGNVVVSWGRGEDGQLGHGDAEERSTPHLIAPLEDSEISTITCGADHTISYSKTQKTVYSWGWGDFGRLGHGNSSDLFIPQPIQTFSGLSIAQIACGDCHCLAVTEDGHVYSWGRNQNGQLGLGSNEDSLVPQRVEAFESLAQGCKVRMLAAGAEHTAAVTEDGKLYGWGWGKYGNLGHGDRQDRMLPALVTAVEDEPMKSVACGWRHTIAVAVSGRLHTFGWSKYGQLGHGDYCDHLVPHIVDALSDFTISEAAGGWRHTVCLTSEGKVYSWGWNRFGQIGTGNNIDQCSPQLIQSLGDIRVATVCCGWRHTLAVTEDGNVFSWGRGTSGQLGHGDLCDRSSPKMIEALSKDGQACQTIGTPNYSQIGGAFPWIAPSERYAVVPDESADQVLLSPVSGTYGTVPEADVKRQKTV